MQSLDSVAAYIGAVKPIAEIYNGLTAVIKESRYLEIKSACLQLSAPLFVLARLNDILRLFSIGGSERYRWNRGLSKLASILALALVKEIFMPLYP